MALLPEALTYPNVSLAIVLKSDCKLNPGGISDRSGARVWLNVDVKSEMPRRLHAIFTHGLADEVK